ncbi:DUF2470 domain-containing protein [Kitasatospora aureofaciens]|uniref:DUF2470 domain-containing protein n=1 Tax=Kitasatospora aureofaciens TaxID=1894 RepID=A0A1E7NCW7_KITAU|nr:DUF2470 domain-containing protein [Kitasatospora aureofaciens]ARF82107.1 hypothetical protein B6264_27420 [Kitasatospora aureofaciens]OEV38494.1 hypothetical protein HS99_0021625 [Kitasatospora aureofaciens]GGU84611.1 hypothetical protein GCM10010502_40710 [Kitasatospora aureofaciens]
MNSSEAEVPEPTTADRVHSLLSATSSLTVRALGEHHDLDTPISVHGSRLRLRAPLDAPLTAAAAAAADGLAVVLDVTDVSPVAVRDRIRARLTLAGRLHLAHLADDGLSVHLRVDVAHAVLATPYGTGALTAADLALATPDPLARHEAALLTHLADDHADALELLTGLLDPALLTHHPAVRPLALDRHGLVLRLDHSHGHRDVRLVFPEPACDTEDFGHRMHELLTAAQHGLPVHRS